ncbi:MAG: hypothetical protein R3F62_14620 [Planctomycetota bacterium]
MNRSHPWLLGAALCALAGGGLAGDEHWSRQFQKPQNSTSMHAGTGLSDGGGKPSFESVQWHDGKLWMSGAWEPGVDPTDLTKRQPNTYWHLWTWSPEDGYQVVCYFGKQGGQGPDGKIHAVEFLPDGRIVVGGAFTRIANPGGTMYRGVNALAIYDPQEPTANRWQPLGGPQYNGTVSAGGAIDALAYDPQGNDLYIGHTGEGIRFSGFPKSSKIHRYDFDTGSYEPLFPGLGGTKPQVHEIQVDTSTKPSTIYVGGKFHYTAGNGQNPAVSDSTARYTTGFASWQEGKGWTTYPLDHRKQGYHEDEQVLQRAADFMHFDSVHVMDFLVDGGDIWIVGAFSEGKGGGDPLRGIAKWDAEKQAWIDPTGKGGVGREVWSIAKADNGKLYFAGAFGGVNKGKDTFPGFKNGEPAACAISYDPATQTWEQLGSGLGTIPFPEVRLCVDGNDVYFVGDFHCIGLGNEKNKEFASEYIARWNETVDFTANPPQTSDTNAPHEVWGPGAQPLSQPLSSGNEHWSRQFPQPPRARGRTSSMSGATGMDFGTGTPDVSGIVKLGDTVYLAGSWQAAMGERWYVWSWNAERGWEKLAWSGNGGKGEGIQSPPEGLKLIEGKLYAYGAISSHRCVGIFDPETKSWSTLKGTHGGKAVEGNAAEGGTGVVNDLAYDARTGDLYLVGNWPPGIENPDYEHPKDVAAVLRIDKAGEYHVMGHDLLPEDPGKPVKGIYAICLDTSKTPADVYIGGTFNYYGGVPTNNDRMAYNVAKWDHEAQDWRPLGKGNEVSLKEIDRKYYPEGLPGLPTRAEVFQGFLAAIFPRVRCLAIDAAGNLYAGGTLAIVDDTVPVKDRKETFGLAKYDVAQDRWVGCTTVGGVSRDVDQLSWLDEGRTKLLLSGSFVHDNQFGLLHNVAILDTTTGELSPLGGGLKRASREHVVGAQVKHFVDGQDLWFAGLFDHAGVNENDLLEAPIQANGIARWNGSENLDPNRGLKLGEVKTLPKPSGSSSVSAKITLEATLEGEGEILWWEQRANGDFAQKAKGPKYTATLRIKPTDDHALVFVSVKLPDGTEGGKRPVRIPIE